jgi:uncharacterized protein YndB with AHSA1/START domain
VGPLSAEIAIDVPRERVFELLADLAVRPAFTDHFQGEFRLLRVASSGVGAGARFRCEHTGWLDSVIVETDAPHRLLERGHGGRLNRVPNATEWLLAEVPGTQGCEVRVTFMTDPSRPLDRLRDRRVSERKLGRDWRRALARLRELAEAGTEPPRLAVAGADRL